MQLDAILEVTIGLVLTWLVISIGVMQVQEWIENRVSWRSHYLEQGIRGMFEDENMSRKFFNHPSIKALYRKSGRNKLPMNIPSERFAKVLMDVFVNAGKSADEMPEGEWSLESMRSQLASMQENNLQLALKFGYLFKGIDQKSADLDKKLSEWHTEIMNWFNDSMSIVSAEYRRNAQKWAFLIGIALAVALNVDSIFIAQELWREPTLRAAIVAQAQAQADAGIASFETISRNLALPLGWNQDSLPKDIGGWAVKLLGFFLSGIAAAQGAPFWYDALRKLVSFKSHPESK
ncbi:MAG TPA: hypothetical protein DCX53_10335 [Anaerolineae bacterium]|nr:hypothetical protein [Anaerolineae bacterium]